jgi:hypothetical protein
MLLIEVEVDICDLAIVGEKERSPESPSLAAHAIEVSGDGPLAAPLISLF